MWETILEGGIMMIPLGICSVLALAIVIERLYSLRRSKIIKPETTTIISNINSKDDVNVVRSFCEQNKDIFSSLVLAALNTENLEPVEINQAIDDQGRQELRRLEKGLVVLETVAGVAPLLGLLGTVLGMIEVFDGITLEGVAKTAPLSSGISQALITTVAGLSVGIFSLIFYNTFTNKTENLILELEKYSTNLVHKIKSFSENFQTEDAGK